MDGLGDHLLAGAGLASYEHRGVRARHLGDLFVHLLNRGAVADDAAEGVPVAQLLAQVLVLFGEAAPMPVLRFFASAELGLAMGRTNVIHAAVLQGPSGRSFVEAAIRFQRYEGVADGLGPALAGEPQDMMDE